MINSILTWFDGKKTNLGAILLFLATFLSEVIVSKWHVQTEWMTPLIETLSWLGMALTGLGLSHKAMKGKSETPTNTPQ